METIEAKHVFTEKEKKDIASRMADMQISLNEAKEEKQSATKTHSDKIGRIQLTVNQLSRHYRDGYEMKLFDCNVVKDYAKQMIVYKCVITGNIIELKPFGPGDQQRTMED